MKTKSILFALLTTMTLGAQQYTYVNFQHHDKVVYGVLSKPEGTGPFQTIIIAPGSGPTDRDGTVQLSGATATCLYPMLVNKTLKPYKQLGDALTKAGYAVLRYNKIEYTYSNNIGLVSFSKLWLPVTSAINYLKTRSDIDTNNIILIGHSESSSLIPHIAKSRTDVKALISLAGSRMPFDSILAFQLVDFTVKCGGNLPQAQANANYVLNYCDTIRKNLWLPTTTSLFGVPPQVWHDYLQAIDPVAANYNQCGVKTLFLGLGLDLNVPPSQLYRFKDEVTITNDFWLIPDLNHYLTPYDDPNIAPVVADTIVYWLRQNGFATGLSKNNREEALIRIHPVPAQSELNVTIENPGSEAVYRIVSTTGTVVKSGNHRGAQLSIDISDMSAGLYVLSLESKDYTVHRRFVKN